jgi:hypothetical protein
MELRGLGCFSLLRREVHSFTSNLGYGDPSGMPEMYTNDRTP